MIQYRGRFFLPGDARQVPGSIIVDPHSGAVYLELDDALVGHRPFELVSHEVLHGELVDGSVATLLDCMHTHSGSAASEERSAAEAYHCRFWLQDDWVLPGTLYDRARFGLTDFPDWTRRRAFEWTTEFAQNAVTVTARTKEPVLVEASTKRGQVQFRVWSTVNHSRQAITFTNEGAIDIRPHEPTSLENILSRYCRPFQDLLTIGTGNPQDVVNLQLATNSSTAPSDAEQSIRWVKVRFAKWTDRPPETKLRHLNLFSLSDLAPHLEASLDAWFDLDDAVHEVRGLATGGLYRMGMFVDQRFLYAAHAVETYHRRRVGGVEVSDDEHRERIKEISDSVPEEYRAWVLEKLAFSNEVSLVRRLSELRTGAAESVDTVLSKVDDWEKWVRDTRNYYTHFTRKKNARIAESGQILALTESLLLLLDDIILKELGLSELARNTLLKQTRRFLTVADWFEKFSELAS